MGNVVDKVSKGVKVASALATVLALRVDINDTTGNVDAVKILGLIPLFRRGKDGKARVLGIRARRFE